MSLFKSFPGPLLKSSVGPLARYGVGDLNRCVLHLTQDWSGLGRGHYLSWTQMPGGQNGATIWIRLQPWGRYGTHQETKSRRPEQMYTPSDTRLEWLGQDHYSSQTRISAGGLKSATIWVISWATIEVGPLARSGNHQEIISRRVEQMYTSSDTRLEWLGDNLLFESDSNKCCGQNRATIRVTS